MIGWERSAAEAIAKARRQNALLLTVAGHNGVDLSKEMESNFLRSPEFRSMVEEGFVLLQIDYGDSETSRSPYYKSFKERLKLRGFPTLLITFPNGHEILRLKGYSSESKGVYLGSIRDAKERAPKLAAARRKEMEPSGYRMWTGQKGAAVFAKLTQLDANKVVLTTEWGDTINTFSNRLSEEDQAWIEAHRR